MRRDALENVLAVLELGQAAGISAEAYETLFLKDNETPTVPDDVTWTIDGDSGDGTVWFSKCGEPDEK